MGLFTAPCKPSSTEDKEDVGEFLFSVVALGFRMDFLAVVIALVFSFFFTPAAAAFFVVEAFFRFSRSRLAKVSASHGAFALPRDAGRSLSHSAEALSPPISRMVRPESTEVSYCSMLTTGTAY